MCKEAVRKRLVEQTPGQNGVASDKSSLPLLAHCHTGVFAQQTSENIFNVFSYFQDFWLGLLNDVVVVL